MWTGRFINHIFLYNWNRTKLFVRPLLQTATKKGYALTSQSNQIEIHEIWF